MKNLSNKNINHIKKDGIEYLQFRKLLKYGDIINHAYGIGLDRNYRTVNSSTDKQTYTKSINDYKDLCTVINSDYINCVKPCQHHT